ANAKFQNGRPVTAADFVYSINRALDPKTRSETAGTYLNDIVGATDVVQGRSPAASGLKAVDDHTLRIEIDKPKAYFLAKLTYPTAYVIAREAVEKGDGTVTDRTLVGTGAFKLAEYVRGDHVSLAANPDYWGGRPRLDTISRRIMPNAESRRSMFDAGEADLLPDVPTADYERDRNDPKVTPLIHLFNRTSVYYFAFNERFGPFKDRRVRRAFTMAIDRDRIVRDVLLGLPLRAQGILPKGVPGYDPDFKGLPYDPR